jgi:hypothetical protein
MKVADKNYCLRIADATKADEEGFKDKVKERIKLIKTQSYEVELAKMSQMHNQRNQSYHIAMFFAATTLMAIINFNS